ncbi:MAG: hypothetical protein JWP67_1897 [Mucilaginibacter sp.]|nr:hypothetical protein [Mucilaginibacter sp.]
MSTFLKLTCKTFAAVIIVFFISATFVHAQCTVSKAEKNGIITFKTAESYQYVRMKNRYNGIAIQIIAKSKSGDVNYTVSFKYTGGLSSPKPVSMNFGFDNEQKLNTKIKLIKVQKTDNANLVTMYYEAYPTPNEIEQLKQDPLKYFEFIFTKSTAVSINVNDPAVMQTQINCLQLEVK